MPPSDVMTKPGQSPARVSTQPVPGHADRFLAFAFAAADLLVETNLEGEIGFAAGAFRSRLGREAAAYIGAGITTIFAASDHEMLNISLAMVRQNGRIPPLVLRLADVSQSPVSVGAFLLQAGGVARLSFSIGPLAAGLTNAKTPPPLAEARGFTRIAELALRQDAPGGLGLVEVKGWQSVRENLSGEDRVALENSIGDVLCQSGQASTASGIADGRYGVITTSTIDMAKMLARLEATLRASPAARHATVEGAQIPFTASDIPKPQAARALRYALGQFAGGGIDAARMAGAADGLAGIIASAQTHAVAVRQTLEERRFRLLYQPVVSLSDRSIHHFEALLRPNPGPGLPFQAPQDFVTFAEALGLSELLDWAVLETAILALSENADVCVAVNMSGLSMQNPAYRKRLLNRLADLRAEGGKLDPSRLMIELTETAEIEDLDAAAATMEQLRSVGVPVCLDDFGAGVAVFRYLRAFGVDHVKLDGDYVRAACQTKRDRLLVASMVELAGTAGACVTAEMIETEEQLRAMQDMGVQFGQGWLFGRPGLLPGSR